MRDFLRIAIVLAVFATALLISIPAIAGSLTEAQLNAMPLDTGMVVQFDQVEMVRFEPRTFSDGCIGAVFLYDDSTTEDGQKVHSVYRFDINDTSNVWVIFECDEIDNTLLDDNTAFIGLHDVNGPNEAFGRRLSPEKRFFPTLYINLTNVERVISLFQKLPGVYLLDFDD